MNDVSSLSSTETKGLNFKESKIQFNANFQLSVESNPEFIRFCFISLSDWSESLHDFVNQSESKPEAVATWPPSRFPRFKQFPCLYFEFSLAPFNISFCSNWLL